MRHSERDRTPLALTILGGGFLVIGLVGAAAMMAGNADPVPTPFTDPRGPDRGPTTHEWEVIATYKTIESMTAEEPPVEVVDDTLDQLARFASESPDNPYVQELYLKGLRVAAYYADDRGLAARSFDLYSRFVDHASNFTNDQNVVVESIRFHSQRLQSSCGNRPAEVAEIESLARRFPDQERVIAARLDGLAAASEDGCDLPSAELAFWTQRLIDAASEHIELPQARWHLRVGVDLQFSEALEAGNFRAARQAIEATATFVTDYPDDFAESYGRWLTVLATRAEGAGDAEAAQGYRRELASLDPATR